ncbi:MAG: hypothetical protein JNK56_22075 [Myxococcales bacterium]|nr:hypothetical protein [Myxococcales bacterium]
MNLPVASAVTHVLPMPTDGTMAPHIDLGELQAELEGVATEALNARRAGLSLLEAVWDPRYPGLREFHQGIRDALFVEIPQEFEPWARAATSSRGDASFEGMQRTLFTFARAHGDDDLSALQAALAELLVFEAVRLRLLVTALGSDEFEVLGGEESDVDAIAWAEVRALLHRDELTDPEVRPLTVILAAANVALARDAAERAQELRSSGDDFREELRMRARLRAALRELRLPEAVLLENALSALLGGDRRELVDLQAERPVALDGMTRQAMDQRVSRGRRSLTRPRAGWPRRRRPALFDLLRDPSA